jgi:phage tail sheath protein FI
MAEVLISPGVLARENDSSFVQKRPVTVGAAIIGPTVKGPVEVPTVVTTWNQYQNVFGTVLESGSTNDKKNYTYFTSIAAYNYFANGGQSLLVARVVSGSGASYSPATSSGLFNNITLTTASANADFTYLYNEASASGVSSLSVRGITIQVTGSPVPANTSTIIYIASGSNASSTTADVITAFNTSASSFSALQYMSASVSASTGITFHSALGYLGNFYTFTSGSTTLTLSGGTSAEPFVLETFSEGTIMNSAGAETAGGSLTNGTADNVRWQIVNARPTAGTFDLLIRRGNDYTNQPVVLETWTNLTLDPNSPNYISRVIGDFRELYDSANNQIIYSGSFPNRSNYVRVSAVNYTTPNFFDNAGNFKPQYTSSIPLNLSSSFGGAIGSIPGGMNFYQNINNTNTQGLVEADYTNMINLLSNADDYKYNIMLTPGLYNTDYTGPINSIITVAQDRGDFIYVVDPVAYNSNISQVSTEAGTKDTSYAAMYWPWLQIVEPTTGEYVWVPASTMIGGVYAYNDTVAEPWFAPAGINRGGLSGVVRAEKKLSQGNRNDLYAAKINPIATFPGTGIVVYGQKTLQLRASALDRVNVRRLLIALKSYISQIALNLVFEQNTVATRNNFLSQVNPYLTSVQQRQGLYAFRVIMDDTNNTPDVVDRNELVGQIYLQPTKTAEFIYLDFNITPTGATFPA